MKMQISQSKDLSIIREKLNHLDQIAGRILDFGKREALRIECNVLEIINEAALLVRLKLEQCKVTLRMLLVRIVSSLRKRSDNKPWNLILNGLSVCNGGHITIETSIEERNGLNSQRYGDRNSRTIQEGILILFYC